MSANRRSDENSHPDNELEVKEVKTEQLLESKNSNKPLLPSNESGNQKKKLTAFERKERQRLEKSGMKKGSLLKYFVKENPEEMQEPVCAARRISRRSTSSCTTDNAASAKEGGRDGGNPSQSSEVECLGEVVKNQANVAMVDLRSDNSCGSSVQNEFEADSDSPRVSDCDDELVDDEDDAASSRHEDAVVIDDIDNLLSSEDKIERWQRQNKRMLQDEDPPTTTRENAELKPPPTKASKLDDGEVTPEKSQDSNTSTPPLRIVNVFTLSTRKSTNDATPSTSTVKPTVNSGERAKKTILIYKESENSALSGLIEKKNWRKVIDIMNKDLQSYKLPSTVFVAQLIRRAILCEDTRVSKDVQSDSLKLLEEIVKCYPPHNGSGRDLSVKYYKEIFEKVFDDNGTKNKRETGSSLYFFLNELHKKLETEKNALNVLILVTQLVVNQFEVYEKEAGVKINPPLFQYFLEEKEGVFRYNRNCDSILDKCFNARSDEEFCIYLKWVDLISRRLGKYHVRQKDYQQLIKSFAKHCCEQTDYGLLVLINLSYKPFLSLVCKKIFEKLKVVRANREEEDDISDRDRHTYLMELSKTLLIKPAGDIVSDVVVEVCKMNSSLTFSNTRVDAANQTYEHSCANPVKGRRKNVKGETRLHILCRQGQDNPVPDVQRHLQNHPEDVNARDNFGNTPLHDCARNNKGNIIVAMMELYESDKLDSVDFLARNESLETPMHLAATYCNAQTTEILIYFARSCGVIDQVLTSANGNGKLPFQLAPPKSQIQKKLTPRDYDKNSMLAHGGFTLDKDSVEVLENSFELKKVLAWWSQNRH